MCQSSKRSWKAVNLGSLSCVRPGLDLRGFFVSPGKRAAQRRSLRKGGSGPGCLSVFKPGPSARPRWRQRYGKCEKMSGSARDGQDRRKPVEREPGPAAVDHPVTVGADQGEVVQSAPALPRKVRQGREVVALDQPAALVQRLLLRPADQFGVPLPSPVEPVQHLSFRELLFLFPLGDTGRLDAQVGAPDRRRYSGQPLAVVGELLPDRLLQAAPAPRPKP
jgi:hypothetical protein